MRTCNSNGVVRGFAGGMIVTQGKSVVYVLISQIIGWVYAKLMLSECIMNDRMFGDVTPYVIWYGMGVHGFEVIVVVAQICSTVTWKLVVIAGTEGYSCKVAFRVTV